MKRSRGEATSPASENRPRKRKKKKKKKKQKRQGNKDTSVVSVPKDGRSNWNNLKRKITHENNDSTLRKTKKVRVVKKHRSQNEDNDEVAIDAGPDQSSLFPDPSKYVACDCEMVGVGAGRVSALARASLVNWHGKILYDKFVRPKGKITDYRTRVSGVRKRDMDAAVNFDRAHKEVKALLAGKILVGHALKNDLSALKIQHPVEMIRDSSMYRPLLKRNASGRWQSNSLKNLSALLGHKIQSGEHSSVEDARASMMVYRKHRDSWETSILKKEGHKHIPAPRRVDNSNVNNDKDDGDANIDIFSSKKRKKKKVSRHHSGSTKKNKKKQQKKKKKRRSSSSRA